MLISQPTCIDHRYVTRRMTEFRSNIVEMNPKQRVQVKGKKSDTPISTYFSLFEDLSDGEMLENKRI